MRRTMVGLMAGRLCALVAESGCIQKGWKGERGGIQKVVSRKHGGVLEGRNG